MLSDWELWAVAAAVESQHGDGAPLHVAERIGALALAGDIDGVAAWQAVAARLDNVSASARRDHASQ